MLPVWVAILGTFVLIYLGRIVFGLNRIPKVVLQQSPHRWTRDEILTAYERAQKQPVNVRSYLPPSTGRRYIIVGASGLVGGWIVRHLLMRGEPPSAIRMLDIRRANESRKGDHAVTFMRVDMTDVISLKEAFDAPWHADVAHLPLTVFHTAAVMDFVNRAHDLYPGLARVNVDGTRNVLAAAKEAGAGVFIATSSATVCVKPVKWWSLHLGQLYPDHFIQDIPNAEPEKSAAETRPEEYSGNYARSKHIAEEVVRDADDKVSGFRTGCIRPYAVYGTGVEDSSSMIWRFLKSGGHPSWAHNCMQNFVDAQNVSIVHLLLESQLVQPTRGRDVGGSAYCVADPNPPVAFDDLYRMMTTLSKSPVKFPRVPVLPVLGLAYLVEAYVHFQRHHAAHYLPRLTGDLLLCQPAVFTISRVNLHFDITKARDELGYQGPFTTIDGVAASLVEWNSRFKVHKFG